MLPKWPHTTTAAASRTIQMPAATKVPSPLARGTVDQSQADRTVTNNTGCRCCTPHISGEVRDRRNALGVSTGGVVCAANQE